MINGATDADKKLALRELYKRDLYATVKVLLGYKDVQSKTHEPIISALEADTRRKLIIVPRGSFKSSIGVVGYSIWRLLRDPNERILIDSELFANSKNFLREIRAHLESPTMVDLFGNFVTKDNWSQSSITIAQRTKNYKESSITCGGVGTVKVGQHFSIIIADDMNSNKNSDTQEGVDKVIRHYKYSQSILDPGGTMVVIGTRYNSRDIPGFILKDELGLPDHPSNGVYDSDGSTSGFL